MAVSPKDYRAAMTADKKSISSARRSPKFNWGESYMKAINNGAAGGSGYVPGVNPGAVMEANDLVSSGSNIFKGKGGALDYLTVGLAPLAFTGYGAVKAAPAVAKGVKGAARAADSAIATKVVGNALKNPRVSVAMTPSGIENSIRSGAVKNMLQLEEEGVEVLRKPGYMEERLWIEEQVLGIPQSAPGSARPTYGAVTSKNYLPYMAAKNAPGATGEAVRMLDPRFNRSLDAFGYALNSNSSEVATQGVAKTRPGVKGSFTISDSFLEPDKLYKIGDGGDRTEATKKIVEMLKQNVDPKMAGNPLTRGRKTFPYLEVQASPQTNPFNFMERFDIPVTTHKGNPFGISPENATARSAALKQFMASQNKTGIRTGKVQAIEPEVIDEIRKLKLLVRNSPPGRAAMDVRYHISQLPKEMQRKLIKATTTPAVEGPASVRPPAFDLDQIL